MTTKHETGGGVAAEISRAMVKLYKECYGKGPTKAHTQIFDDVVVCLLEGGLLKGEQTLVAAGRMQIVTDQRGAFHDVLRQRFVRTVERLTGRRVESFMSGVNVETELNAEVFVLGAERIDTGDEGAAVGAWARQTRRQARELREESVRLRAEQARRRRAEASRHREER